MYVEVLVIPVWVGEAEPNVYPDTPSRITAARHHLRRVYSHGKMHIDSAMSKSWSSGLYRRLLVMLSKQVNKSRPLLPARRLQMTETDNREAIVLKVQLN